MPKISAKCQRGLTPNGGAKERWGMLKQRFSTKEPTGGIFYTTWKGNPSSQMWFFVQVCSSWQDFNWLKGSRGLSAAAAELLVIARYRIRCDKRVKSCSHRVSSGAVQTRADTCTVWTSSLLSLKGKERKSIYRPIAPFCTKVHTKRSGMDHTVVPANNTMPAFPSWAFTRWHHHNNWGSRHPIAAYYITVHYIYNYYNTASW